MITPQDLRMSNAVFGVSDRVETVTRILEDGVYSKKGYENEAYYTETKNISGIPITEERLLKLGFQLRFNSAIPTYWKQDNNYFVDIVFSNRIGYYFMLNTIQHSKPPEYVHQLQNLYFALTGTELTFKE